MNDDGTDAEVVIVGAGLAGAATAWRLAQRGVDVLMLERTRPANAEGSSHGSARIFRLAYDTELYTRMAVAAGDGWAELEDTHGEPLITWTGALGFGDRREAPKVASWLQCAGQPHELLSEAEAARRWPGIEFRGPVLWHPGAGVLDAERAVEAMLRASQAAGARLLTDWPVERIERTPHGFLVRSSAGDAVRARRVVVAAGAWLPMLLPGLPLPVSLLPAFEVRQENAFHFPYRDNRNSPEDASWPTLINMSREIVLYGLPGGRDAQHRGQKIAEFNGGRRLSSASRRDGVVDPANRARVVDFVRRRIPGLIPEPYAETTCLFTNTPSEDFVIDAWEGLTVVSACSGHGAKFMPEIGRIAADLTTGAGKAPPQFQVFLA
ncbi:FAD-dependent oxidoreductase [Kocuria sp. JC486]|uniref:FAD-dependent oxidoreductase n=1 Tax=Kocuria sp. JC486 TaxID=1970736 RepID=UPI00141F14B2|nr:FAD-dependent oxidoreductase [Kocuria sp. JC486]NHU84183.1 FAD-dependent oxidoreductase [Kocuria sp. JC486]